MIGSAFINAVWACPHTLRFHELGFYGREVSAKCSTLWHIKRLCHCLVHRVAHFSGQCLVMRITALAVFKSLQYDCCGRRRVHLLRVIEVVSVRGSPPSRNRSRPVAGRFICLAAWSLNSPTDLPGATMTVNTSPEMPV